MSKLSVSHCCNDLSNVAERIVFVKYVSYVSLRSVSTLKKAGNGFLRENRNKRCWCANYLIDTYKLVFRFWLNNTSKYFVFTRFPSIGRRNTREISGMRNDEEESVNVHLSQTLQITKILSFLNWTFPFEKLTVSNNTV